MLFLEYIFQSTGFKKYNEFRHGLVNTFSQKLFLKEKKLLSKVLYIEWSSIFNNFFAIVLGTKPSNENKYI